MNRILDGQSLDRDAAELQVQDAPAVIDDERHARRYEPVGGRIVGLIGDNASDVDLIISPKSLTMAAVIVATGPIILVYPWIQRYFMKGIRLGSIKG